jgi:diphthamide synthase (EF-2-diphthine--ammonia ligase)
MKAIVLVSGGMDSVTALYFQLTEDLKLSRLKLRGKPFERNVFADGIVRNQ